MSPTPTTSTLERVERTLGIGISFIKERKATPILATKTSGSVFTSITSEAPAANSLTQGSSPSSPSLEETIAIRAHSGKWGF